MPIAGPDAIVMTMSVHRHKYPDAPQTAAACARSILTALEAAISGHSQASLAVSGGSTPKLLFQEFAKAKFPWDQVHLFFVDERCVPPTSDRSNYKLCNDNFLEPAHFPRRNVHRIPGEIQPDQGAVRYAEDLTEFFELKPGEFPHFDVIHRGIGPDAHTASLFPGEPKIDDHENLTAAVYVEKFKEWRVTLLPGVLLAARHTVMLVAGDDKQQAVHDIFHRPYDPKQYPAQITSHHGRSESWFLDEAAAARMDG